MNEHFYHIVAIITMLLCISEVYTTNRLLKIADEAVKIAKESEVLRMEILARYKTLKGRDEFLTALEEAGIDKWDKYLEVAIKFQEREEQNTREG